MDIITGESSTSSISSSMSETSSVLSSISSCCSHGTTNLDSNANDNTSDSNGQQTSLQYILNQNQSNYNSLDYWDFDNNCDEEDLNPEYSYYYSYPDSQFDQEYYQQHGKLVPPPPPPPPPPMEMDILEDNQILSSDEFNSIFESFAAVVEGHNLNNKNNNFSDDGCMRDVNCSNGLLDDEQLSKALGAIAMI